MNSNIFAFTSGMYYAMCFSQRNFIRPTWRVVKWLVVAIAATAFVLGVATRHWAHDFVEARLQVEPKISGLLMPSEFTQYEQPLEPLPSILDETPAPASMDWVEHFVVANYKPTTTGNMAELLEYTGRYTELVSMTVKQLRQLHKVPSRYTRKKDIVKFIMDGEV